MDGPENPHEVWIHVDKLQRDDRRVWTVQWHDGRELRSQCVEAIHIQHAEPGTIRTVFRGSAARQPRAYLLVPHGTVTFERGVAVVRPAPARA